MLLESHGTGRDSGKPNRLTVEQKLRLLTLLSIKHLSEGSVSIRTVIESKDRQDWVKDETDSDQARNEIVKGSGILNERETFAQVHYAEALVAGFMADYLLSSIGIRGGRAFCNSPLQNAKNWFGRLNLLVNASVRDHICRCIEALDGTLKTDVLQSLCRFVCDDQDWSVVENCTEIIANIDRCLAGEVR